MHGTYNPKYNDRSFNLSNSEHIDQERAKGNIYWDCYHGIRSASDKDKQTAAFSDVEKMFYEIHYSEMQKKNTGLLIWGGVGTGKSFFAGCIANALMEQEVPVCMTNFAWILNELNNSFSGRNEVVDRLCRYPLLIIDDFGMERDTDYALEQVYNIIDSCYRSKRSLIITTNLTLDEIRHPQDVAHARIYDRVLEMCVPVSCFSTSIRKDTAQEKLDYLKSLIG